MGGAIEAIGDESLLVDYIRHYVSSVHGLVREKHLYQKIREITKSKATAVSFTKALGDKAGKYVHLISPTGVSGSSLTPESKRILAAFQLLRAEQVRPLLLAIYLQMTPAEAEKCFRLTLSGVVRVIVSSLRGGTYENLYCDLAKRISDKSIKSAKDFQREAAPKFPSNSQFKSDFAALSVTKSHLARYFLICLEKYDNSSNTEWQPSDNEYDVNLEHVMPSTLSSAWPGIDEDMHRSLRNRLGNLALLSSDDNSNIGNASFASKKPYFQESTFETTKLIAQQSYWGQSEIDWRQAKLADLATKTWPLDIKRRDKKGVAAKKNKRRSKTS